MKQALVSGALLGLAFVPGVPGVVAWFALIPLMLALERRVQEKRGARSWFALGYAGGAVFFLIGTHWIALLSDVALTIGWLKYLGWVLAGLYLALYWAPRRCSRVGSHGAPASPRAGRSPRRSC